MVEKEDIMLQIIIIIIIPTIHANNNNVNHDNITIPIIILTSNDSLWTAYMAGYSSYTLQPLNHYL